MVGTFGFGSGGGVESAIATHASTHLNGGTDPIGNLPLLNVTQTFTAYQTLSAGLAVQGGTTLTGAFNVNTSGNTASITGNASIVGGLTVSAGLTLSSGGISITGNSSIAGTFSTTGLYTASGGITVSSGALTVSSGGANITGGASITGNSTITGTLGGLTGLTVASGNAIITSGNVGIGTTSPTSGRLQLAGETTQYPTAIYISPSTHATSRRAGLCFDDWLVGQDSGGTGAKDFFIYQGTATTQRLLIDTYGRVGIGTSSPSDYNSYGNALVVAGGDTGLTIASGVANYGSIHFADGTAGNTSYRGQLVYNHSTDTFTISTASTERMQINSSGQIGIGGTAAGAICTAYGSIGFQVKDTTNPYFQTMATSAGTNLKYWRFGSNNGGAFNFETVNDAYSQAFTRFTISNGGNVGIGTTSPRNLLELSASTVATSSSTTLRVGGIVSTYTAGNYTAVGQEVNRHRIVFSSWRDVYPDTLGAKIEAINYTNYNVAGNYHISQRTDLVFSTLSALASGADSTTEKMRITADGYVGINNNAPSAYLVVNSSTTYVGAASFNHSGAGTFDVSVGINNSNASAAVAAGMLRFSSANASNTNNFMNCVSSLGDVFIITSAGRVAIGGLGAAPSYSLHLAADSAAKPTSNTWTISSDARVKEIVGPYTRGVADIMALEPKRYRLNGAFGSVDDGRVHVSVIAQEAQATWPEMIGTYEHADKDEDGVETVTELLNLNTNELQWALVNAIKELAHRVEALEA